MRCDRLHSAHPFLTRHIRPFVFLFMVDDSKREVATKLLGFLAFCLMIAVMFLFIGTGAFPFRSYGLGPSGPLIGMAAFGGLVYIVGSGFNG